jgi:LmbE family N-acetylglucosaminyl deacetylase
MSTQPYTYIYLSPHLDDAVFSCGGAIATQVRAGERVLVVTVFAATPLDPDLTPFTRELKARWGGASDPVAVRRQEDLSALRVLGAQGLHLPYADCVYRFDPATSEAFYPDETSIFADVHPAEATWHLNLLGALRAAVPGLDQARLYAPLTAGHHVDHLLVHSMGLALERQGAQVAFYEDYPYASDAEAIRAALERLPGACWDKEILFFGETEMRAKTDAVACHASQITTFWRDEAGRAYLAGMQRALRNYALQVGTGQYAENVWHLAETCLPLLPEDLITR